MQPQPRGQVRGQLGRSMPHPGRVGRVRGEFDSSPSKCHQQRRKFLGVSVRHIFCTLVAVPKTCYKHPVLDGVRWTLILMGWVGVAIWLWGLAWYWGALWLVPGLVVMMNAVGFAMLPIYCGLNARSAERVLMDDLRSKRRDTVDG
ncbi:MAG: hypothetical protein H7Y88_05420 [Phycisphaerales bacterium]|nr:hypothetical protein [Phycisphaerales bacterium]